MIISVSRNKNVDCCFKTKEIISPMETVSKKKKQIANRKQSQTKPLANNLNFIVI